MEIIIAVGVLMVISSVGVVTVRGFDDRTKEVKVQNAAREVYNVARAKAEDNSANTKPQDAATEYNNSQTKKTNNGNRPITTKVISQSSDLNDFYVEAYYDGGRIRASYGDDKGTADTGSGGSGTPVIPTIKDTVSQLTYQCDTTTTGYLPVFNVSDSTTVSLLGSDGSEKLVDYESPDLTKVRSNYARAIDFTKNTGFNNISEELTMKAGVSYTVKVYGAFTNLSVINGTDSSSTHGAQLSFRDCLVSIDKLGKDTGLTNINWVGGKKFTKVTDSIPSTVTDLDCVFAYASIFNDPNVAKWDVSNVTSLYFAFLYSNVFDQNLNNWNTKNVTIMSGVFYAARAFNNADEPFLWETSNVISSSSMFAYANKFNQNISEQTNPTTGVKYWDTSKVSNMGAMFKSATAFNNGAGSGLITGQMSWKTDNVTNMSSMFEGASSFNALIYRSGEYWNVSKVTNFSSMFKGASKFSRGIGNWQTTSAVSMASMFEGSGFNQPLSNWNTARVTNMTSMFKDASSFNRDLSTWNVSKVTADKRVDFNTGTPMANNAAFQPKWT